MRSAHAHRTTDEVATGALLFLIYCAITVWWLWPLPAVWKRETPQFHMQLGDFYIIVWALAWECHALITAPWRLFDANTFHPARLSLANSDHFLGYLPLFAPVYALSGNPILAINVMTFLTYPLCAIAMYCLMRRWTGRPTAFVAGLLYAFSFWRFVRPGHVHLLGVQYFPLVLLFLDRWLETARRRDAVLLGLVLTLQAASTYYLAYALILMFVPAVLLALWRWRARVDRRRLLGLAIATGCFATLLIVSSIPYLELRSLGVIVSYDGLSEVANSIPMPMLPMVTQTGVLAYLRGQGVGVVGYALALVALLPPYGTRRWPLVLGLSTILIETAVALGPEVRLGDALIPAPYSVLAKLLPGFATVRFPARFVAIAHLGFALLAGIGLERLIGRLDRRAAWPVAVATGAAAILSYGTISAVRPHPEVTRSELPPVYRWLAANGRGRPVLELPRGDLLMKAASRRMYLSCFHWLPIFDGYAGYVPRSYIYLYDIAGLLPDDAALQSLVNVVDVEWIVVHTAELRDWGRTRWQEAQLEGLDLVQTFDQDWLYHVTRRPQPDQRALLFSRQSTRGGVPLAPLRQCPGSIEFVGRTIPENHRRVDRLTVTVENSGKAPWPVESVFPPHTVHLTARITTPRGRIRSYGFDLAHDVPPGASITREIAFRRPFARDYLVEIGLEQSGDGPLSACGVVPITVRLVAPAPPA